ncbi:MAG: hypothetical protein MJ113_01000, partial [Lachnospiraceae bacterium]|nr:hypothetical protein [Lachnospiraceae bacterium]
ERTINCDNAKIMENFDNSENVEGAGNTAKAENEARSAEKYSVYSLYKNFVKYMTGFILVLLLMYYFVCESVLMESKQFKLNYIYKLNDEWSAITEQGMVPVKDIENVRFVMEENQTLNVCRVLPEITETTYLMFDSNENDVIVYVGNSVRNIYTTKKTQLTKTTSARKWIFVELKPSDSGKLVTVSFTTNDASSRGEVNGFYFGNLLSLIKYLVVEHMPSIIMALALIVIAIFVFLMCLVSRIGNMRPRGLKYLCLSALCIGFWMLNNSGIRQFFVQNVQAAENVSYLLGSIFIIPLLVFVDELQSLRYRYCYITFEIVTLLIVVVRAVMQIFSAATLLETLIISDITSSLVVAFIVAAMGIDLYKKHIREYLLPAIGLVLFVFSWIFEIASEFFGMTSDKMFFAISFLIMFVLTSVSYINKAKKNQARKIEIIRDYFLSKAKNKLN